ncbi:MAG: hypothetical protein ACRD23_06175 [Terriglobales bacterium]
MGFTKSASLAGVLLLLQLLAPKANAQLTIVMVFDSDPSGITLIGSGTPIASLALGSVQAFGGTVPTGVTRTVNGSSSWTLSTPFDVKVTPVGGGTTYTLTARLLLADAVNIWKIGAITLNSGSASTLTTTGTYSVDVPITFSLTIPFSEAAGLITNTINFTATSN